MLFHVNPFIHHFVNCLLKQNFLYEYLLLLRSKTIIIKKSCRVKQTYSLNLIITIRIFLFNYKNNTFCGHFLQKLKSHHNYVLQLIISHSNYLPMDNAIPSSFRCSSFQFTCSFVYTSLAFIKLGSTQTITINATNIKSYDFRK